MVSLFVRRGLRKAKNILAAAWCRRKYALPRRHFQEPKVPYGAVGGTAGYWFLRFGITFSIIRPMIPDYFAVIGAVLGSLGGIYYLVETAVGKVQPNRVTWLLWALFPMIIFIAQRVQGVENLSWATFAAGFNPLLIVLVSFINKKSYWKTEPRDYMLMAAATVGLILWAITKEPNLAILFSLVADILASLPTVIKAYKYPETESWRAYAISAVGFGIGVLAIQTFTFENTAFISYIFIINALLAYLAFRK